MRTSFVVILRQAFFWSLLFTVFGLIASRNYLLFHGLAEVFSIVIAGGIFMFAWTSRSFLPNHYLLFVGIAYLFVGSLDLIHTLAFRGMEILKELRAEEATQLWIAARYLESLSLLAAPLFLRRNLRPVPAMAAFGILFALLLGTIFYWDLFPHCYIEGEGLTPFKIYSEYAISLILLGAIVHLLHHRQKFERDVLQMLVASMLLTTGAELTFTAYISVYDWANFTGHLLKILSFYLIYQAVIRTGLLRPYSLLFRDLKRSQEELHREKNFAENLISATQAVVLVLDRQGMILHYNPYLEKISGRPLREMQGKAWLSGFMAEEEQLRLHRHFSALTDRTTDSFVAAILDRHGKTLDIEWRNLPLTDEQGEIIGLLCTGHNITEILQVEREREQLILDLQAALQKVKTLSGLLPICASCKKIRDDQGYWKQIEVYIRDHSDADFTHGICPGCARRLYPELYEGGNFRSAAAEPAARIHSMNECCAEAPAPLQEENAAAVLIDSDPSESHGS